MRQIASQASSLASSEAVVPTYTAAGESACLAQSGNAASSLAIWFFYVDHVGVGNAVGYAQAYPIVVDTKAQAVGDAFSVSQQLDSQLTVTISATPVTDTIYWNIYCDPEPGHETSANEVPFDAATNGAQCVDASRTDASDAAAKSEASAEASTGTEGGSVEDAAGEDAAAPEDASPVDSSVVDAAIVDAAIVDAAIVDSSVVDASVGAGDAAPVLDDAGGTMRGALLNDAGVPYFGSCTGSGILQPGTSTATSAPATDDAGQPLTDDAGATIYVDAGVFTGTPTLGIPSANLCGTVSTTNPTLTLTGLRDGDYYSIAVAAVDGAGNVGPLSVICQPVVQLADFWYLYTQAGGQAGGGYCSAAEVGVPAGTGGLGLLMIASVVAIVRKRRRR